MNDGQLTPNTNTNVAALSPLRPPPARRFAKITPLILMYPVGGTIGVGDAAAAAQSFRHEAEIKAAGIGIERSITGDGTPMTAEKLAANAKAVSEVPPSPRK